MAAVEVWAAIIAARYRFNRFFTLRLISTDDEEEYDGVEERLMSRWLVQKVGEPSHRESYNLGIM